MKTLYFDLEHGSQTLGSQKTIQEMFGYSVLSPASWDSFLHVIGQIYTKKKTVVQKAVGPLLIDEEQMAVVLQENAPSVDAVVVDTFSELSKKFMRSLVNKDTGKMMLQDWGKLKNRLDICLEFVTQIPGVVICNCHSKIQTMDDGQNKLLPYIDGSTKEDIAKWFDFVFYTKTNVNLKNNASYTWITGRSEKYDHAKDRTGMLEREIPQDYQLVLDAAKKAGFNGCKILVIGTPGSGKTYALKTLVGKVKKETTKNTKETEGVKA